MNLQAFPQIRQKAAHRAMRQASGLACACRWGSVAFVDGTTMPASSAHHLFRTPSQGRASCDLSHLPAPFSAYSEPAVRQGFAHVLADRFVVLQAGSNAPHLSAQTPEQKEGWARCEQKGSGWLWHFAPVWRPVATTQQNKRFMAVEQGSWARSRLTATRCWVRQPVLRPTSSIARHKTPATDASVARNIQAVRGLIKHAHNAALVRRARGGVLRSQTPKTKDIACSTRS